MTAPATAAAAPPKTRLSLAGPQRLGRSLMLPIAALPAAGLLLRLGQDDLLGAVPGLHQVAAVVAVAAGALDYLVNFGQATRPLRLIPIGLGYAVVYYVVFRFVIRRWNLRTPGRELENGTEATEATESTESPKAA